MKIARRLLLFALVMAFGGALAARSGAVPAAAQAGAGQGSVTGDLLKDWQSQKSTLMLIADAMPLEKFDYKPTAIQRSYGEQIMHVALTNLDMLKLMGGKAPAPAFTAESVKTKAE